MGMTAIEKILARAAGIEKAIPGESLECKIDFVGTHDLQGKLVFTTLESLGVKKIPDPERFAVVLDHQSPANSIPYSEIHRNIRETAKRFGVKHLYDVGSGILHVVLAEEGFILPGELIVMNESHTPTGGALGAAVIGVGQTDAAVAIATGSLWLVVPETIRIQLKGQLKNRVSAKDIGLKLMSLLGYEVKSVYKALEIGGDISSIGMDGRFTITNFCSDMGAKCAFMEADEVTAAYLRERARRAYTPVKSDSDCLYVDSIEIESGTLEPLIACPHSLDNIRSVRSVSGLSVNQAVIGSCTNSRLDDIKVVAEMIRGHNVASGVRFFVSPGSRQVLRQAIKLGYIETLVDAGVIILAPGCGSCYGEHSGVLAAGEVAISSGNRNWKGRMGSPQASVYLASPETVTASAITGVITDPRDI